MNEKLLLITALMLTLTIIYRNVINILDKLTKIHQEIIKKEIKELKDMYNLKKNYIRKITRLLVYQSKLNYIKIIKNEKLIKHNFLVYEKYLNTKIKKRLFESKINRKKLLITTEKKISFDFYAKIIAEIEKSIIVNS